MLDARMAAVASAVPKCRLAADIGSDHGLIPLWLLEHGVCERAVVTDISAPSLQKAEVLFRQRGRTEQAEFVCCDGFPQEPVPDAVVIAGMGGLETIKILKQAKQLPADLVLQPMRNVPDVRRAVIDMGYRIKSDRIVLSKGKYYSVIALTKGSDRLTALEESFGRSDLEAPTPVFLAYLEREQAKAQKILSQAGQELSEWRDYAEKLEYALLRCRARAGLTEEEDEGR